MISFNFETFLATLFPAECQTCGKNLASREKTICPACLAPLLEHRISFEESLISGPSHVRSAWAAFRYQGQIRTLLQRIKFKHEFYLIEPLSQMAAGLFQAVISDVHYDALIPMPVDWTRRLNRRFNQSEILTQSLAKWGRVPTQNHILYKKIHSHPQSVITKEERMWNLFGAFGVRNQRLVEGKSLLLIDDIITTGSSASEAAKTLLDHGAKRVDLFTLARSILSTKKAEIQR
jgi:competence protein ComFC